MKFRTCRVIVAVTLLVGLGPASPLWAQQSIPQSDADTAKRHSLFPRSKDLYLSKDKNSYVGFGGEIREAAQLFKNENWGSLPPGNSIGNSGRPFFLQRYMLYSDFQITRYFRWFVEWKSGIESGRITGPRPNIDRDDLDIHQFFADLSLFPAKNIKITLRSGRQELHYGDSRLISVVDGPNVRLAFQGLKLILETDRFQIDWFYVNPVNNNPGIFDDQANKQKQLFGTYSAFSVNNSSQCMLDAYFLVNRDDSASYFKGAASEKRNSFGIRLHNNPARTWSYDLEGVFQNGRFGDDRINAYMAVAKLNYAFQKSILRPVLSLTFQIASGDRGNKSELTTFNPLYPRIYYGLGVPYWPSDLVQFSPACEIKPVSKLRVDADIHAFWRESKKDGLYLSGRLTRSADKFNTSLTSGKTFVGVQYDLNFSYSFTAYSSLEANFSALPATGYIKETGIAMDIFFANLQAKIRL